MSTPIHRIIHIDNLDVILRRGSVVCSNHPQCNPQYREIGNNSIIEARKSRTLPFGANLTFQDYISFYFGPRSIMLFNIKTGFNVPKVHQSEIIYLVSTVEKVIERGYPYFFTDGNGTQAQTQFYTDITDLSEVDMEAAFSRKWSSQEMTRDPDIKRKKHAEFHIYWEIQVSDLEYIVVFDDTTRDSVDALCQRYNLVMDIREDRRTYYF